MCVVRINHVEVRYDRIVADASVLDKRFAYTSPELIDTLLSAYPNLLRHTCVNGVGKTFGAVAVHTSLPHLIEHMAIENQVRSDRGTENATSGFAYVGKSFWTDRSSMKARIELNYTDDLVALAALRDAVRDVNQAASLFICHKETSNREFQD